MYDDAAGASGLVDWRAVARGAGVGLIVIAPVTVLRAVVDHRVSDFARSNWPPVFLVGILAAYVAAGWLAGRWAPSAPLTNGAFAALGTLALWLPVRVVIWAVRDDPKGLFTGSKPVLSVGGLFGNAVLAVAAGMIGGILGARYAAQRDNGGGGEPAGRPRTGGGDVDRSEERPDSTGQGAG
jgi:hypothetical protein